MIWKLIWKGDAYHNEGHYPDRDTKIMLSDGLQFRAGEERYSEYILD